MHEYLEVEELKVDDDDEITVSYGTAAYAARIRSDRSEPHIEVYSVVLTEVDIDPGLLEALNEINRTLGHTRVFWHHNNVVMAGELVGFSTTAADLACLCQEIGRRADVDGQALCSVFGGKTLPMREEDA
jgi:hypothetical protein